MSELAQAMRCIRQMSTVIVRYSSGHYGIAGSVPFALTEERRGRFYVTRESKTFETEEDAINALLAIGVTHFQHADRTWHDAKEAD